MRKIIILLLLIFGAISCNTNKENTLFELLSNSKISSKELSFFSNIKEFENFIVDKNLSLIFITTFFAAYFTISMFIKVINKIGFTPFVIYRVLLGFILLYFYA